MPRVAFYTMQVLHHADEVGLVVNRHRYGKRGEIVGAEPVHSQWFSGPGREEECLARLRSLAPEYVRLSREGRT